MANHPDLEQLRAIIRQGNSPDNRNNRPRRKRPAIVFLIILLLFSSYIYFTKPSYYGETVAFFKESYEKITGTEEIKINPPTQVKMEPLPKLFLAVEPQAANVRRDPNIDAQIDKVVSQQANLEYVNERTHDGERYWLKVKLEDGYIGWISGSIVYWRQESIDMLAENGEAGNVVAMKEIGEWVEYGIATEKDLEVSFEWYKLAADTGEHEAQFKTGLNYQKGHGVEKSYKRSVKYFQESAQQGNAKAMLELGYSYMYGLGVKENGELAKVWLDKSIEYQHPDAQIILSFLYLHGAKGLDRDLELGIQLMEQAEAAGNLEAKEIMEVYRSISQEEFIGRVDRVREKRKALDRGFWGDLF